MSEVSWIKVQTDLFENRKIKRIMAQQDGDAIALLWVRLLTLAGETNDGGAIYFTQSEPYTSESLAEVFGRPKELIEKALEIFVKYDMIEVDKDGVIRVVGWSEYQSADRLESMREYNREAQRRSREKKKSVNDTSMTRQDIDKEEEKEEDKDKESPTETECARARIIRPTEKTKKEIETYIRDKGYKTMTAERFISYCIDKYGGIPPAWRQRLDSWEKNDVGNDKKQEGSFETADFIVAALKRSYGE